MNVWSAAEGESRAFSRRFWVRTKIETKGDSLLDRRFASKKKKKIEKSRSDTRKNTLRKLY